MDNPLDMICVDAVVEAEEDGGYRITSREGDLHAPSLLETISKLKTLVAKRRKVPIEMIEIHAVLKGADIGYPQEKSS